MDIRYRDGSYDAQPTAPFTDYTMLMEFNLDGIPAGHSLRLELTEMGMDQLYSNALGANDKLRNIWHANVDRPSSRSWF